jgi:hypothetical protein
VIKVIRWLLGLCNHKWEVLAHKQLERSGFGVVGSRVYHRCTICTQIKSKDFL